MLVIECLQEYFVIQMGAFTDLNNKGGVCQYTLLSHKKSSQEKRHRTYICTFHVFKSIFSIQESIILLHHRNSLCLQAVSDIARIGSSPSALPPQEVFAW